MKTIKIMIADDHTDVRSALRLVIEHEPGYEVTGEATTANDLIARLPGAAPDVLLLDWELPGVRAVHLVPVARSLVPGLVVVALSGNPEARDRALSAGADAFVCKGEAPEALLETLHKVAGR